MSDDRRPKTEERRPKTGGRRPKTRATTTADSAATGKDRRRPPTPCALPLNRPSYFVPRRPESSGPRPVSQCQGAGHLWCEITESAVRSAAYTSSSPPSGPRSSVSVLRSPIAAHGLRSFVCFVSFQQCFRFRLSVDMSQIHYPKSVTTS